MSGHADVGFGVALALTVLMVGSWLVSLAARRTAIDFVWGIGFILAVWVARAIGDGDRSRINLLTAMVTIWGLRLTALRWWRSRGALPDADADDAGPLASLLTVFATAGLIMFAGSLPVQLAVTPSGPEIGWVAVAGVVIWGSGLVLEFRVPNRLGEVALWWGLFLVAAEVPDARFGIAGPIVMTLLAMRESTFPGIRPIHAADAL